MLDWKPSVTRCACFKGPEVWFQWCCWQMEGSPAAAAGDAAAAEVWYARVRRAFEDALAACGLHVTLGSNLWTAYREFETQLLHAIEVCSLLAVFCFVSCLAFFSRSPHASRFTRLGFGSALWFSALVLCSGSSHNLFLFTGVLYDILYSQAAARRRAQRKVAKGDRQAERTHCLDLQAPTRTPTARYSLK